MLINTRASLHRWYRDAHTRYRPRHSYPTASIFYICASAVKCA